MKTFSGGMKRRIGIAQAIINEPEILILDEPTAGLDPRERIRFSNIISDMGKDKIVLLSTHIVSDIEAAATELVVVKKGKVLETGNVDELVQKVRGQVWETVVSQKVYQQLRKERSVIHLKQVGREVQVRFLGEEYPEAEGSRAEPTLEDYYVFAAIPILRFMPPEKVFTFLSAAFDRSTNSRISIILSFSFVFGIPFKTPIYSRKSFAVNPG